MFVKNKIVVTGGRGRFAQTLKKIKSKHKFIYFCSEPKMNWNINKLPAAQTQK